MNNPNEKKSLLCRPLPIWAIVAMSVGIGASLAVSVNLATGIAIAGGLFAALLPSSRRRC